LTELREKLGALVTDKIPFANPARDCQDGALGR
jgi:hypothetical protein